MTVGRNANALVYLIRLIRLQFWHITLKTLNINRICFYFNCSRVFTTSSGTLIQGGLIPPPPHHCIGANFSYIYIQKFEMKLRKWTVNRYTTTPSPVHELGFSRFWFCFSILSRFLDESVPFFFSFNSMWIHTKQEL